MTDDVEVFVPLSYERLCLKVSRLERTLRARDHTLHMLESEHIRLVDALEDQRAYAHRLLLRAREAEAKLREIIDGVAHV